MVVGTFSGRTSPATVHTSLVGTHLELEASAGTVDVALDPSFEHGLYVIDGSVTVRRGGSREAAVAGQLVVSEVGAPRLEIVGDGVAQLFLVGGVPFPDPIHMWWNFVAGAREPLERAVDEWNDGERFGVVIGSGLPRVPAPRPIWLSAPS